MLSNKVSEFSADVGSINKKDILGNSLLGTNSSHIFDHTKNNKNILQFEHIPFPRSTLFDKVPDHGPSPIHTMKLEQDLMGVNRIMNMENIFLPKNRTSIFAGKYNNAYYEFGVKDRVKDGLSGELLRSYYKLEDAEFDAMITVPTVVADVTAEPKIKLSDAGALETKEHFEHEDVEVESIDVRGITTSTKKKLLEEAKATTKEDEADETPEASEEEGSETGKNKTPNQQKTEKARLKRKENLDKKRNEEAVARAQLEEEIKTNALEKRLKDLTPIAENPENITILDQEKYEKYMTNSDKNIVLSRVLESINSYKNALANCENSAGIKMDPNTNKNFKYLIKTKLGQLQKYVDPLMIGSYKSRIDKINTFLESGIIENRLGIATHKQAAAAQQILEEQEVETPKKASPKAKAVVPTSPQSYETP